MEKQKNKPKNTRGRLNCALILKVFLSFIVSLIAVVALLIIYAPTGEIHQTSLPEELRPTAEYLLETVQLDEVIEINDEFSLSIHFSEESYTDLAYSVCIYVSCPFENLQPYHNNSWIVVNDKRVRGYVSASSVGWSGIDKCVEGDLELGLHLIEFHLRDSRFGELIAIQQWAIEIE